MFVHITRRLGPESNHRKQVWVILRSQHFDNFLLRLAWHWSRFPGLLVKSRELLRRQLDKLNTQMNEMRQLSTNAAMNAAVTGLTEAVRTIGQSVSKPRPEDVRVGMPEPYFPGKDFVDWDFMFNGYAGTLAPAFPRPVEDGETVNDSGGGTGTTRTTVCNAAVPSHDAHTQEHEKSWGKLETTVSKLTDNCAWCTEPLTTTAALDYSKRSWRTSSVPGSRTWKNVSTNFWSLWDETMRRTVQIFCWTWESWETSMACVWRRRIPWGADVFTRRQPTWTPTKMIRWKSTPCPGKGRGRKEKSAQARKVAKQAKKATQARITVSKLQRNFLISRVSLDTVESMDKAADCWHEHPKPQGKGKGKGKLKSKVSEVSGSEDHKHDDGAWTPASLSQTSGSSRVNAIREVGCVDEGRIGMQHQTSTNRE